MNTEANEQRPADLPVKVLYLTGTGRSGSTVLANVLGSLDGYFAAGEVRFLWSRGVIEDRLCGCGKPFSQCRLWTSVLDQAGGPDSRVTAHRMLGLERRLLRLRHLPRALVRPLPGRRRPLGDYTARLEALYRGIASTTGARVVVDSSKLPLYGALLRATPGLDVAIVHLVRDVRAAAFSWSRRKRQPDRGDEGYMERRRTLKSALLWDVWNAGAEALWGRDDRYLRLRYEDVIADPRSAVAALTRLAGAPADLDRLFVGRDVALRPNHSVAGNPDRLRHGLTALRLDAEWKTAMPAASRGLATVVAAPLLARYGYPLRTAGRTISRRPEAPAPTSRV